MSRSRAVYQLLGLRAGGCNWSGMIAGRKLLLSTPINIGNDMGEEGGREGEEEEGRSHSSLRFFPANGRIRHPLL